MYYHKRRIIILLLTFSIIFIGLLAFSNHLMKSLRNSEKNMIILWADAVQKRSQLMQDTRDIFQQIDSMEHNRAKIYATAYQRINELPNHVDLTFYEQLINSNTSIPYILTDKDFNINASRNFSEDELEKINTKEKLQKAMREEEWETIPIRFLPGEYIYLHYKESKVSANMRKLLVENYKSFTNAVIQNVPAAVPVIVTDTSSRRVFAYGNVDSNLIKNPASLEKVLNQMKRQLTPFPIKFGQYPAYVYYEESNILKMTRYFPYLWGASIIIFFIILIIILLYNRQMEQNHLWTGLTKETAHQLGTPISALMAWTELLKSENINPDILSEIRKDVERLDTVSRRFSNIESVPELKRMDIVERIQYFINYYKARISSKIQIELDHNGESLYANINENLFEWVLENLGRNAVDAMEGQGFIRITCGKAKKKIWIDIQDTGKGMSRQDAKKVFLPGFTTKTRGWGVGLTLCQRIVKSYHNGEIEVRKTEIGKGTTFRITLPEA